MLPIPAEYQFVVALAISLCVGGVGVWNFMRGLRAPPAAPFDLKVLGAAFNDAQALRELVEHLEVVAEAARQLKSIRDREAERDIQRWEKFIGLLERIADAVEGSTGAPRRRA